MSKIISLSAVLASICWLALAFQSKWSLENKVFLVIVGLFFIWVLTYISWWRTE